MPVGCGPRERSREGSAAAGGRGAQLRALAAQAEHSHRGQLNAGFVCAPGLGNELGGGKGSLGRDGSGRCTTVYLARGKSVRGGEARFEAAGAVAKDAAL